MPLEVQRFANLSNEQPATHSACGGSAGSDHAARRSPKEFRQTSSGPPDISCVWSVFGGSSLQPETIMSDTRSASTRLAASIVSAYIAANETPVSAVPGLLSAVAANPGGSRRRTDASRRGRARCQSEGLAVPRSHRLPELRRADEAAASAYPNGSRYDSGRVPAALGLARQLPHGRVRLCEGPIGPGEGVRFGASPRRGPKTCQITGTTGMTARPPIMSSATGYYRRRVIFSRNSTQTAGGCAGGSCGLVLDRRLNSGCSRARSAR